jgi:predicted DNA-binding transcriptional regulator AlpA
VAFRENKKFLQEHFPKRLTGIQMEKLQLLYQQMVDDSEMMQELEDIINYAASQMKTAISSGAEIYEFIEDKLVIFPVGIMPLDSNEGYFFLSEGATRNTRVYQYRLSIFEKHDEKYRSIRTEFIAGWERNIANSYENIKAELIRHKTGLPNPAVYSIEVDLTFPVEETLLPIAKRSLVRYLTSNAA